MQDMIKRILEMDRKAQEITEAAQKEKIEAEKQIAESVQTMREDMLSRARRRIRINRDEEAARLEAQWQETRRDYQEQIARMDALYEEKSGEWVDRLVERVLNNA